MLKYDALGAIGIGMQGSIDLLGGNAQQPSLIDVHDEM